jgi:hypothetical protein
MANIKLSNIIMFATGAFAKDARQRIKNNQIEINGEKVTQDIEIDVVVENEKPLIFDAGSFLCEYILINNIWKQRCQVFGVEALWLFDNDLSKFFSDYLFIKTSKKQMFVIKCKIK